MGGDIIFIDYFIYLSIGASTLTMLLFITAWITWLHDDYKCCIKYTIIVFTVLFCTYMLGYSICFILGWV